MFTRLPFAPLLAVGLLAAAPAPAQQFGQWSWDANAAADGEGYSNEVDGTEISTYEQQQLRLGLGVNGYILHPAIAAFRLGLGARLGNEQTGDSQDTALDGSLSLFPRSFYPARIYAGFSQFEFQQVPDETFALLSRPESQLRYGARFRVRKGWIGGLRVGLDSATTQFEDPRFRDEESQDAFVSWTRGIGSLNHHYRIDREFRRYGTIDLETEDLIGTFDEHGSLFEDWRWDLTGNVRSRRTDSSGRTNESEAQRLRTSTSRSTRWDGVLGLGYGYGSSGDDSSHSLSGTYSFKVRPDLRLQGQAAVTLQDSPTATAFGPSVGVAAIYGTRLAGIRLDTSATVSIGQLDVSGDEVDTSSRFIGWDLGTSVSYGNADVIEAILNVSLAHNETQESGVARPELPDLGQVEGVGTQDATRAELILNRDFTVVQLRLDSRIEQIRSTDLSTREFEVDTFTSGLGASTRWGSLHVQAGSTRISQSEDQEVRFLSAGASYRLSWFLSLRASYRQDQRQVVFEPDVNGTGIDVGASARVGAWEIEATYFHNEVELADGPSSQRINQGFRWSIGRRFSGWLPLISAPVRRGTIR